MTLFRMARLVGILSALMLVVSACVSATDNTNTGDGSSDSEASSGCDSVAVASALAPGSTFDYEPSESPADLAASSVVVFRADVVSSIAVGEDWSTVAVDEVDIILDRRANTTPIFQFGGFGAGIENRPTPDAPALSEMTAIVFAHHADGAPGNLSAAIEGLWLQCPGETPVSVVATPTGEAWHEATASIDAIAVAANGEIPVGEIVVRRDQGDGWQLVDTEPGYGHPHEVAIMTSERALDRAGDDRWFSTRPEPNFADEVVIVLAPSVSGSCPGIIFEGLTITESQVFGLFEPGPAPAETDSCTADANPISFVFVVDRQALPTSFVLSVEEEVICGGCDQAEIDVDLSKEAALETALWGAGSLDIVIDGTSPADGTANVFRWEPEAALLLPASEFIRLPRWIQGFDSSEARTIEAFVVSCGEDGCPEECDDVSCQDLEPLGNICTYDYKPEAFVDHTLTINWNGIECTITAEPGRADR